MELCVTLEKQDKAQEYIYFQEKFKTDLYRASRRDEVELALTKEKGSVLLFTPCT